MTEHVLDRPIRAIGAALRDGSTTAEALIEEAAARHDRRGDTLKAYKYWDGERAKGEARAVDKLLGQGRDAGPMMGMPISFKDIYGIAGMPTCAGTPKELPEEWQTEGPVAQSLRGQLAIPMGKTHSVEFAFGGVGTNAHWDPPRNPWDAEHYRASGGSSSGAGVSIAEGSALIGLGTDTGGSVRIPASVTGHVGLKVTIDRWSVGGIVPLSSSFDTPGLLARSVEDAIVAFSVIDGIGNTEALFAKLDGQDASSLRLGMSEVHYWDNCFPGVAEGVRGAIDELTGKGARLVDIPLPESTEVRERFVRASLFGVEGLSFMSEHYPDRIETLDPNIGARIEAARGISAVDYFTERRLILALARQVDEKLRHVDVLVAPTVPCTPPTLDEVSAPADYAKFNGALTQNTQPINLLELCSITMPVALDAAGMPVGMQLICRQGHEERLLAAALACEKALGNARDRLGIPPLCRD